jgi:hypothetical protein
MRVLGLKVRSGLAIGVLVDGSVGAFRVLCRLELPLTHGQDHYARFPFHPLIEIPGDAGVALSAAAVEDVKTAAREVAGPMIDQLGSIAAAVLVVGSLLDPDKLLSPHMRVHAREGALYRRVLAELLEKKSILSESVTEKDVRARCAAYLKIDEAELKRRIQIAGRELKPWRHEEKSACCGALLRLPQPGGR